MYFIQLYCRQGRKHIIRTRSIHLCCRRDVGGGRTKSLARTPFDSAVGGGGKDHPYTLPSTLLRAGVGEHHSHALPFDSIAAGGGESKPFTRTPIDSSAGEGAGENHP